MSLFDALGLDPAKVIPATTGPTVAVECSRCETTTAHVALGPGVKAQCSRCGLAAAYPRAQIGEFALPAAPGWAP